MIIEIPSLILNGTDSFNIWKFVSIFFELNIGRLYILCFSLQLRRVPNRLASLLRG